MFAVSEVWAWSGGVGDLQTLGREFGSYGYLGIVMGVFAVFCVLQGCFYLSRGCRVF